MEDTLPLISHSLSSPPPSPPLTSSSYSREQHSPPPYQQGPVSPRYYFDTNYIKAKVGDSPTVRFTVTSEPPLTPETEHFLTHYKGGIATKRFKVQHDVIEFQEVRLSDTGFYTISCTNTAGLEGKETLELEVFRDIFETFVKKASKIKRLAFTTSGIPSGGPVGENNQIPMSLEAEETREHSISTRDSDSAMLTLSTTENSDHGIEPESPEIPTVETSIARNAETSAKETTNVSRAENLKRCLLPFIALTFIFVWSIPLFIGIIVYYRRAARFSEARMTYEAQFNTRIAQFFVLVWILSIAVGITVLLIILATTL